MRWCNYAGLAQMIADSKLPQFDLIVGIERSGIIPATMLALHQNTHFLTLTQFINGFQPAHGNHRKVLDEIKKVLVLDDSINTGETMLEIKLLISKSDHCKRFDIEYGAVILNPTFKECKDIVDYYWIEMVQARFFQWNWMHHKEILAHACLDMDGVLCRAPTTEENDDGDKYKKFIETTQPRYIPSFEIGAIVTCRLEKYRELTEKWLKQHNVKYKELHMMDHPTKEARIKAGDHADYKAEFYKNNQKYIIFVDDDMNQARRICELAGKSVLLTTGWMMIQ